MVLQGRPEDRELPVGLEPAEGFWAYDTYLQFFNFERDIPRLAT